MKLGILIDPLDGVHYRNSADDPFNSRTLLVYGY